MAVFDGKTGLKLGLEKIEEDLDSILETSAATTKPGAFEGWVVRNYLPAYANDRGYNVYWPTGQPESYDVIGWGAGEPGERQIDVGLILEKPPGDEAGDPEYIAYVGQCYAPEEYEKKPKPSKMDEVGAAISGLRHIAGNDLRKEFMQTLETVGILTPDEDEGFDYKDPDRQSIQGFFFSLGELPEANDGDARGDKRKSLESEGHQFVGIRELSRWSYTTNNDLYAAPSEMRLDFVGKTDRHNEALVGYITAGSLRDFYHDSREESPYYQAKNHSLLNRNLRFQLPGTGADVSKIAGGMETTLEEEPEVFHKYNNGIVIVAERFELDEEGGGVTLYSPQIVNGGQTTNAIYDFIKKHRETNGGNPSAFDDALVSVKLIAESDKERESNIARYANRQNPIDPRDEHSTDEDQEEVQYPWFDNKDIYWNYKRGMKGTLTNLHKERVKVTSKQWKEIENTQAAQNFLASIGDPVTAYTNGPDGIFRKDNLVRFIFAANRTEDLQRKAASDVGRLKSNEQVMPFPNIREGVDEFGKDSVLWWAIQRFCYSVSTKGRKERSAYVKAQYLPGQEEELERWQKETFFMANHWKYAAIRSVNLAIEKHCGVLEGEDLKGKREEMRKALLGEEYLESETLKKIFATQKNWNSDITVESDTTDITLLSDECSTNFPLLGKWLFGIEKIIAEINHDERNKGQHWKSEQIYKKIEEKVKTMLNQPHKLIEYFPEQMPTNAGELGERLVRLKDSFDMLIEEEVNDDSRMLFQRLKEDFETLLEETPDDGDTENDIISHSARVRITKLEEKLI